jgi:hypothetical protein
MTMSNDKSGTASRQLVPGEEEYEVRYLAAKLNISERRVREAIKTVGLDRQKVTEYLTGKKV